MNVDRVSRRFLIGGMLGMAAWSTQAGAMDVFDTERQVSASAAGKLLGDGSVCTFDALGSPLTLRETVERALCNNSQTRQAWINVKIQSASVGAARATYLPTITGSTQGVHDESGTEVTDHPELNSRNRDNVWTAALSVSWVLFDFGGRDATCAAQSSC